MSKSVVEIIGRLEGDLLALQGFAQKFAPPHSSAPTPSSTFDQPPPQPAAKPTKADYDYLKKLLDEVQGLAKSASDEVDKETKAQQPQADMGSTSSSPSPEPAHSGQSAKK